MNNPEKKERKKRIKDQNAKSKKPPIEPIDEFPVIDLPDGTINSQEDLDRVIEGFAQIFFGIMKVVGIDPLTGLKEEDFPSEIDAPEI